LLARVRSGFPPSTASPVQRRPLPASSVKGVFSNPLFCNVF
jgi:hypothetical protein